MVVPPPSGNSDRYSDGSFSESEDIYMTINTDHGPEFTKEPSQNERQISIDPISFQGSTTIRQASFRLVSPPSKQSRSNPVPSPPSKLTFVSTSHPSSGSSSPQNTNLLKKIWRSPNGNNKPRSHSNLLRMQSTIDETRLEVVETSDRRSRSLGGSQRFSTQIDDFDLCLEKSNKSKTKIKTKNISDNNNTSNMGSYTKPPLGPRGEDRQSHIKKSKSNDQIYQDDGFNCGKLCLFLPRGKGKPVRSISEVSTRVSRQTEPPTISRTVSMERFECGSWGSTLQDNTEGDSANLFFDLPMEMLRCSVSDMQSAVTATFVFDNENDDGDDVGNDNNDPADFNAFLEAQI